jgi:DNA-binding transcriptional regulator YhcF (GntR family)
MAKQTKELLTEAEKKQKVNELADRWIQELSEFGYTYDDMLSLFREATRQFNDYKKRDKKRALVAVKS